MLRGDLEDTRVTGNLSITGRPAGFWLRFTAALIDLAVFGHSLRRIRFLLVCRLAPLQRRFGSAPRHAAQRSPDEVWPTLSLHQPRFLYRAFVGIFCRTRKFIMEGNTGETRARLVRRGHPRSQHCLRAGHRWLPWRTIPGACPPFRPLLFFDRLHLCRIHAPQQALHDIFASCLVLCDPSTGGLTPIKPA